MPLRGTAPCALPTHIPLPSNSLWNTPPIPFHLLGLSFKLLCHWHVNASV